MFTFALQLLALVPPLDGVVERLLNYFGPARNASFCLHEASVGRGTIKEANTSYLKMLSLYRTHSDQLTLTFIVEDRLLRTAIMQVKLSYTICRKERTTLYT